MIFDLLECLSFRFNEEKVNEENSQQGNEAVKQENYFVADAFHQDRVSFDIDEAHEVAGTDCDSRTKPS